MSHTHKCCRKQKLRRGLWSPDEDEKLLAYITKHGPGTWSSIPERAGIERCGKSCRLRWINYLRPGLKRGPYSESEERRIIELHRLYGNKWSKIATHLPGRTDNEVKNLWNSSLRKRVENKISTCSTSPTMSAFHFAENAAQVNPKSAPTTAPSDANEANSLVCSLPIVHFHPVQAPQAKNSIASPPQHRDVALYQASPREAPIIHHDRSQQIRHFNQGVINHDQAHVSHDVLTHEQNLLTNSFKSLDPPNYLSMLVANDDAMQASLQQIDHSNRHSELQTAAFRFQAGSCQTNHNLVCSTSNNSSQHHSKETLLWLNHLHEEHSSTENGRNDLSSKHVGDSHAKRYRLQYDPPFSHTSQSASTTTCSDDNSIEIPSLLEYLDVADFLLEEASYQLGPL